MSETKKALNFDEMLRKAKASPDYYAEGLRIAIGDQILSEMQKLRITQKELARRLEAKEPRVTKILRGHSNLTIESMATVAFALGMEWECNLAPIEQCESAFDSQSQYGLFRDFVVTEPWPFMKEPTYAASSNAASDIVKSTA